MSVFSGRDLAPSRQPRRWPGRLVAFLLVVLVVGGAAYAGYDFFLRGSTATAALPCPSAAASPEPLPSPAAISLTVRNSTTVNGLAGRTAAELTARGFTVLATDNAPGPLSTTEVHFGPGGEAAARVVALQFPSAQVLPDPALSGRVEVVLGVDFTALRSPEQVDAARAALQPSPSPSPTPSPCRSAA